MAKHTDFPERKRKRLFPILCIENMFVVADTFELEIEHTLNKMPLSNMLHVKYAEFVP
jgi:hypothetical protein